MKIEVGKSLISSWLMHAKSCQVVQTNWKPSIDTIEVHDEELLDEIINDIHNKFFVEMNYELFNTSKRARDIIQDKTINLLGLELDHAEVKKLYAIEAIFVEDGIKHGKSSDIIEDILRQMMAMTVASLGYFSCKNCEMVFASPIVSQTVSEKLDEICETLTGYFNGKWNMNFTFRVICNNAFKSRIVDVIHALSESIIDDSELYMRSIQIYNNFSKNSRINRRIYGKNWKKKQSKGTKHEAGYDEIKVSALVQTTFSEIAKVNLPETELQKLTDHDYCQEVFKTRYPFLKKIDRSISMTKNRIEDEQIVYYGRVYALNGKNYLLVNDWHKDNKEKYIDWFKGHLI